MKEIRIAFRLYPTIHQTKGWNKRGRNIWSLPRRSLSYNPSNQGLKHVSRGLAYVRYACLYPTIHQTKGWNMKKTNYCRAQNRSLSYNPSNQGLKLISLRCTVFSYRSISYNPSNKGMKPRSPAQWTRCAIGLYPTIHQTKGWNYLGEAANREGEESLSYNPSNQGLKQAILERQLVRHAVFILQSIKPRVETSTNQSVLRWVCGLYPTIHQTKGWNLINFRRA